MNNSYLAHQLSSLAIALVASFYIWWCYRWKTVGLERRYSTFWPRLWTGFVDASVLWPIGLVASLYMILDLPKLVSVALVIVGNLAWLFYTVLLHARYGQTVGKMATKVRVVDYRTEGRISVGQAWLREGIPLLLTVGGVIYEISLILNGRLNWKTIAGDLFDNKWYWLANSVSTLWFAAEVLTMLTNRKRRALHDFIAGTVVVRTNVDYGNPNLGKASQPGPGARAPAPVA